MEDLSERTIGAVVDDLDSEASSIRRRNEWVRLRGDLPVIEIDRKMIGFGDICEIADLRLPVKATRRLSVVNVGVERSPHVAPFAAKDLS